MKEYDPTNITMWFFQNFRVKKYKYLKKLPNNPVAPINMCEKMK